MSHSTLPTAFSHLNIIKSQSLDAFNTPELLANTLQYLPLRDMLSWMCVSVAVRHFCVSCVPVSLLFDVAREEAPGYLQYITQWRNVQQIRVLYNSSKFTLHTPHKSLHSQIESLKRIVSTLDNPCVQLKILMDSIEDLRSVLHLPIKCTQLKLHWNSFVNLRSLDTETLVKLHFVTKLTLDIGEDNLDLVRDLDELFAMFPSLTGVKLDSMWSNSYNISLTNLTCQIIDTIKSKVTWFGCRVNRDIWQKIKVWDGLRHLRLNDSKILPISLPIDGCSLELQSLGADNIVFLSEGDRTLKVQKLILGCKFSSYCTHYRAINGVDPLILREVEFRTCDPGGARMQSVGTMLQKHTNLKHVRFVMDSSSCEFSKTAFCEFFRLLESLNETISVSFVSGSPQCLMVSMLREMTRRCADPERFTFGSSSLTDLEIRPIPENLWCPICGDYTTLFKKKNSRSKFTHVCRMCKFADHSRSILRKSGYALQLDCAASIEDFAIDAVDSLKSRKRKVMEDSDDAFLEEDEEDAEEEDRSSKRQRRSDNE